MRWNKSRACRLAVSLLVGLAPGIAFSGDQLTFTSASGYAGGKKCAGGMEGGDESALGGKKLKPSEHTWENPKDGWVMVAVAPALYKKMRGCSAKIGGKTIKIADVCPACRKNGKMDISHSECHQMGNNPEIPKDLDWDCANLDKRGRAKKLDPKKTAPVVPGNPFA